MKRVLQLVLSFCFLPFLCLPVIAAVPDITSDFIVTPLTLVVSENETTATFSVSLSRMPTDDVMIPLVSSDPSELVIDKTVLVFTDFDYNVPQIVTVTGVDDDVDDDDQTVTVILGQTFSLDVLYDRMKPNDVNVIVQDNDVTDPVAPAGVTVTPRNLTVNESGTTATFNVYLNSRPTDNVTIPMVVFDTTEISIDKTNLVFTISDYNIPQTITVTGVDDEIGDGNKLVYVVLDEIVSTDTRYEYMDPLDVNVIVQDNDPFEPGVTPGVIVTPLTLIVDESGSTATFSVYLNSQPTDGVYLNLVSNDPSELSISTGVLGFQLIDYNVPQIVTVTGIDDEEIDGDQIVSIILDRVYSTDLDYDSMDPVDVSVTVKDNDAIVNPFRILSSDPAEGAINLPWSQSIAITFSENIRLGMNFGNIIISDAGNPIIFTYRIRGSVLILNPKRNFLSNSFYTVTIPMGAVEDMLGNTLAIDYSFTFATKPKR